LLAFLVKILIIKKKFTKMKKLLIPFVIISSIMITNTSCKKADTINEPPENLVSQEILKKVTDFITVETEQEVNKPKLNDNLITTAAHFYNINETEKIVVIGIREPFITPVITIKKTIKYFVAKLDGSDNVLSGNIIELVSGDKLAASTAEKTILTNYTKSANSFTGILINLSTTNQYLDEITYSSGKIINTKKLEEQSQSSGTVAARSCLAYYLNVYEDGVLVSSTYLYTICTGNGAGSGTGCEQTRIVESTTTPLELKNCGGGGGGGNGACGPAENTLQNAIRNSFSVNNGDYTGKGTSLDFATRNVEVKWKFHQNTPTIILGDWGYRSIDGFQIKRSGLGYPWKIISFTHYGTERFGFQLGFGTTINVIYCKPDNEPSTSDPQTYSDLTIKYQLDFTVVCNGAPIPSIPVSYTSHKSYTAQELADLCIMCL
jgi:hypothetical protein